MKLLLCSMMLLCGVSLSAATFTVTNLNDSGAGSLRDAINQHEASGGTNTIDFDAGLNGAIALASSLPPVTTGDLTITGPGADVIAIDGGGSVSCMGITAFSTTVSLTIEGLTVTNGSTSTGAGVYVSIDDTTADLILTDCAFTGHSASTGGAAVYAILDTSMSSSTLNLTAMGCTFAGNSSDINAGAVLVDDVFGTMTADFTNCTFSGNSADSEGGAIHAESGTLTLTNCTFTDNTADEGGGIFVNTATVNLRNTIVAGNSAITANPDISGSITSDDGNLIGDESGLTMTAQPNDQVGSTITPIDPLLDVLADNGGPTMTHALLTGSPAIDAGVATGAPAVDQRGETRDANPDVGAFEASSSAPGNGGSGGGDSDDDDEGCTTGRHGGYTWLALLGVLGVLTLRTRRKRAVWASRPQK